MKTLILFSFICFFSLGVSAQGVPQGFDLSNYGVRIEPDKRVMAVLATLEAARTTNDAGELVPVLNTPLSKDGLKFREQLKSDLAALNGDLRTKISQFVIAYKKRNPDKTDAQLVAPFISMAYALTPVPDLADPLVTSDLPGSLLDVLDFAPLVRDFYRRSSFSGNINDYIKTYQASADGTLRNSSREMVSELLGYLHTKPQLFYTEKIRTETQKGKSKTTKINNVETRSRERRFFIVPEMLAPVGDINFLNIKDDYFVVLSPGTDLTFSEVRRAFLQFVIDPLVIDNNKDIATIRDSIKLLLDERRKVDPKTTPDAYLTISRSLVAAIDAKQNESIRNRIATEQSREKIVQMKTVEEKKAVSAALEKYKAGQADETLFQLSEDYEKGAILVFYFADQLGSVEDSGFDIASSMREMILAFDASKEKGRYALYADARKRAVTARENRRKNPSANMIADNPVTTRLLEIKKTIDSKNYSQAGAELNTLLAKHPAEPRIYYNLGRVASLSAETLTDDAQQKAKLLEAKEAFEKVLRIAEKQRIDAALVSLSYVALAKIYEFYDDRTYAIGIYDAAIKVGDVTGGAYSEALAAKARLIKEQ